MTVFVRGSNPVWTFFDLTGNIFDDTFYMFVLQNTIPYLPATVYHDFNGDIPWNYPIQFLANGTLPIDIYWDPTVTYRLEFRQGNTQADPLIYEVNNYQVGQEEVNPPGIGANTTDNQITNPQFALVNFGSPSSGTVTYTGTAITTQTISVAPGWFLDLTGSGNVTLTQVLLNSSVTNPSNASYALRIQLSGTWTKAILRQRFNNNGVLWAGTYVSSNLMALSATSPNTISAALYDSTNALIATVLPSTALTGSFVSYPYVTPNVLPASVNTQFPPTAYIEYRLILPASSCDITLTSMQLISGETNDTYDYAETTNERQRDFTFHHFQPQLNFKPIESLLCAWDFATNPAQFFPNGGVTINTTPAYVWDQTIMRTSSGTAGVTFSPTAQSMVVTTGAASQSFYLLQYLQNLDAVRTTLSNLSVNINAYSITNPGVVVQVFILYGNSSSTIPTLPTAVCSVVAGGGISSIATNWSLVNQFTGYSNTGTLPVSVVNDIGLIGWNGKQNFGQSSVNNFAIVATFTVPTSGTAVVINSISCVPGDIPTRPAPELASDVLKQCQYYWEMSYAQFSLVGTITSANALSFSQNSLCETGLTTAAAYPTAFGFQYQVPKRALPIATFYDVSAGTVNSVFAALYYPSSGGTFAGAAAVVLITNYWNILNGTNSYHFVPKTANNLVGVTGTSASVTFTSAQVAFQYTLNARLGDVA